VLPAAPATIMITGRYVELKALTPDWAIEAAEAVGAAGYVLLGLGGLVFASVYFQNSGARHPVPDGAALLHLRAAAGDRLPHGRAGSDVADIPPLSRLVDPTVQVLVLTDVVIEATVTALLLALAVQAHKRFGRLDPADLRPLRD